MDSVGLPSPGPLTAPPAFHSAGLSGAGMIPEWSSVFNILLYITLTCRSILHFSRRLSQTNTHTRIVRTLNMCIRWYLIMDYDVWWQTVRRVSSFLAQTWCYLNYSHWSSSWTTRLIIIYFKTLWREWRPLLPYGYSYKASCTRPGLSRRL